MEMYLNAVNGDPIEIPSEVLSVFVTIRESNPDQAPVVRLNATHDFDLILVNDSGLPVRVSPSTSSTQSSVSYNINPQASTFDTDGIINITGGGRPSWRIQMNR